MNVLLKCLLYLILVADMLVLLVLVASYVFGFSFSVRITDANDFRTLTRMESATILAITVLIAFVSLVLLKRLRLR